MAAPTPSASDLTPAAAQIARYRKDFAAALGRSPAVDEPIALAVSGGPDSMALLALAHAACPAQVIAATVDHGLRPESADEARTVHAWCAGAGVPHETLASSLSRPAAGNLHQWAREMRYSLLLRWAGDNGALTLSTAHHLDDQAETFLMRAARGAGVAGLAAIRARRSVSVPERPGTESITILRPLLGWRRAELRALAIDLALPFADDPSNRDPAFDRVRWRELLAGRSMLDPVQLAASARHAADAEDSLCHLATLFWRERVAGVSADVRIDMRALPRDIRRRLVRRAIERVRASAMQSEGSRWSDAANVERLLDSLEAGKSATQAGVMVSAKGTVWRFRPAPARRSH